MTAVKHLKSGRLQGKKLATHIFYKAHLNWLIMEAWEAQDKQVKTRNTANCFQTHEVRDLWPSTSNQFIFKTKWQVVKMWRNFLTTDLGYPVQEAKTCFVRPPWPSTTQIWWMSLREHWLAWTHGPSGYWVSQSKWQGLWSVTFCVRWKYSNITVFKTKTP